MKAFVTIITMPGGFSRVRHDLRGLFSDLLLKGFELRACHDVVGFCDVIAEVFAKVDIEGFFDSVLEPLMRIPDVNRVISYPVLRPSFEKIDNKPITGYVFINVIPTMIRSVQEKLLELKHIVSTDVIAGEYDVVAKTNVPPHGLSDHTAEIHNIAGVKWSETLVPHDVFRSMKQEPS